MTHSLTHAAMSAVPSLRRLVVRRSLRFSESDIAGVTVKIADTADEVLGAAALVHDAYVARGLLEEHPSATRVTAHAVLPTTHTLVAKIGERVVGAISMVKDGPIGLPLEGVYRAEVEQLRAAGDRLAEVGSLAIAPEHRNVGLVQLLYRYVFDVASARDVDRFVIAVHPRSESAYSTPLLFERFGGERHYPGLNGCARSVGLTVSFANLAERMRATFGEEEITGNPYYVYSARKWEHLAPISTKPMRGVDQRVLARALVAARPDVFEELSPSVLAEIRREIPGVPLPRGSGAAMRLTPSWWTSQFAPT